MNKRKYWCSALIFMGVMASSQIAAPNDLFNGSNLVKVKGNENSNYEGSPYMFKDYEIGRVGSIKDMVLLQYNVYKDEILFKRGEEIFELPKTVAYNPIIIDNVKIELVNGEYYVVLAEGKSKLLQKDTVSYERGGQTQNGYVLPKPNSYDKEAPEFYIYTNGKLEKLDKRFKNISTILPNFQKKKPSLEEITKYINSQS